MRRALGKVQAAFPKEVASALFQEREIEMTEMKKRTPVLTGALRSSGMVNQPVIKEKSISVMSTFGAGAEAYALVVHEDLEAVHTVGQAKYMSSVQEESADTIISRIGKRINLNRTLYGLR